MAKISQSICVPISGSEEGTQCGGCRVAALSFVAMCWKPKALLIVLRKAMVRMRRKIRLFIKKQDTLLLVAHWNLKIVVVIN